MENKRDIYLAGEQRCILGGGNSWEVMQRWEEGRELSIPGRRCRQNQTLEQEGGQRKRLEQMLCILWIPKSRGHGKHGCFPKKVLQKIKMGCQVSHLDVLGATLRREAPTMLQRTWSQTFFTGLHPSPAVMAQLGQNVGDQEERMFQVCGLQTNLE